MSITIDEDSRNKIGGILVEKSGGADNLAIVLCTYFSNHQERPDDDPETERGWGEWVENKCNEALDLIAASRLASLPTTAQDVIAKARNEALEKAAKACEGRVTVPDLHDDAEIINALNNEATECARDIRALKTEVK